MKRLSILIIAIVSLSCSKDEQPELLGIEKLENELLVYVEGAFNEQTNVYPEIPAGNLFNVYVNGIMFNSDGTYDLYFGGYDKNPTYQKIEFIKDFNWTDLNGIISIETGKETNPSVQWTLRESSSKEIVVTETYEGNQLEYKLISK